MTGLRIRIRGSSLRNEPPIAGTIIAGSNRERTPRRGLTLSFITFVPKFRLQRSKKVTGVHGEMFLDRAESQGGKEGQAADDQDHSDQKTYEKPAIGREGSSRGRHDLLARERTCDGKHRDGEHEAADPHGEAERRIPERRGGGKAREGATIVARGGNISIKRLAEALRAGIGEAREAGGDDDRYGGEAEHRQGQDENR